jgi:hypothetical protein
VGLGSESSFYGMDRQWDPFWLITIRGSDFGGPTTILLYGMDLTSIL